MKMKEFTDAVTAIDDAFIAEAADIGQTVSRIYKKRRSWAVVPIAAALLAMAVLCVNAAAPVDLGFYLAAVFGDSYEMLDEMTSMPYSRNRDLMISMPARIPSSRETMRASKHLSSGIKVLEVISPNPISSSSMYFIISSMFTPIFR